MESVLWRWVVTDLGASPSGSGNGSEVEGNKPICQKITPVFNCTCLCSSQSSSLHNLEKSKKQLEMSLSLVWHSQLKRFSLPSVKTERHPQ